MPAAPSDWPRRLSGDVCPYCPPRSLHLHGLLEVAPLGCSTLYLKHDQRFRGYCVLVYARGHVTALEALLPDDCTDFLSDLRRAAIALRAVLQPDHLNYECLGNQTPHLHWHLIPRFQTDPRWGYPIWDGEPFEPRQELLPEAALWALRASLRSQLSSDPL